MTPILSVFMTWWWKSLQIKCQVCKLQFRFLSWGLTWHCMKREVPFWSHPFICITRLFIPTAISVAFLYVMQNISIFFKKMMWLVDIRTFGEVPYVCSCKISSDWMRCCLLYSIIVVTWQFSLLTWIPKNIVGLLLKI